MICLSVSVPLDTASTRNPSSRETRRLYALIAANQIWTKFIPASSTMLTVASLAWLAAKLMPHPLAAPRSLVPLALARGNSLQPKQLASIIVALQQISTSGAALHPTAKPNCAPSAPL